MKWNPHIVTKQERICFALKDDPKPFIKTLKNRKRNSAKARHDVLKVILIDNQPIQKRRQTVPQYRETDVREFVETEV